MTWQISRYRCDTIQVTTNREKGITIQIRLATVQDYAGIARISYESQEIHAQGAPTIFRSDTPGFFEDYLRHLIEDESSGVYVAEDDRRIVGYIFLHVRQQVFLDFFHPQTVAIISDIAVLASMRRKGVGQLLFDTSLQWARERHADRLELNVWEFNMEARTFYERNGM